MRCNFCTCIQSKVIDSRSLDDDRRIRRRRECLNCGARFTTYEVIENNELYVIKKDESRQPFNRKKIFNGLLRACEKRPVSVTQMEEIIDNVEQALYTENNNEAASSKIGDLVLEYLKRVDEISYIRFASVYKQFEDIDSFLEEIKRLT